MTIWPISHHSDENSSLSSNYPSLFTPPNSYSFVVDSRPISPRLEVGNIDAVPFSQNFTELFDGLGLHMASSNEQKWRIADHRSPDTSYEIESYTNIKELNPEWKHNETEEIGVMSPKRPGELPTIHEDVAELSINMTIGDKVAAVLSDFQIEELDQAFSRVDPTGNTKMCTRRDDKSGKKYLIKRRRARKDSEWVERTILETLTNRSLSFVECMHWALQNGEYSYMVIDYNPGITLADLITQQGSLGSHRALFYASELVSAISSLHDAGIVHRDIQPRNVILDAQGHIVLTNFAHAETLSGSRTASSEASIAWNLGDSSAFKLNEYRAPELYLGWSHNSAVDCWSFGVILYFMFFVRHPYGRSESEQDDKWFYDRVVGFEIPTEALRLVHPMARDLILKCLERNASMRWTMDKIKTHGYFSQIDWDQVSAKRLDVPSFGGVGIELDRTNLLSESQEKHLYPNPSLLVDERQLALDLAGTLRRTNSLRGSSGSKSAPDAAVHMLPEVLKPAANLFIPTIIQEEDESTSISASTGHPCEERHQRREEDPAERMSRFWADIDRDERCTATSIISLEFGGSSGAHYTKAPKLRKHRSAIQTTHRLFNLSTSSFHNKLRRKPRSTSALRQPQVVQKPAEQIEGLPIGVHQIGSGIGFTYNVPAAAPSKVSVCSLVLPTCTHLFHGGLSVLNIGLRGGSSGRRAAKVKAKAVEDEAVEVTGAPAANEILPLVDDHLEAVMQGPENGIRRRSRTREEVGSGTFIREMYRTPSWILSPPDNLPSPLALVNSDPGTISSASTGSPAETELLTPATLVDCPEDYCADEVTISIPKGLQIDLDTFLSELTNAPGSTLRLVPPVRPELRLSYDGDYRGAKPDHDESMFSDETSVITVADA